MRNAVAKPLSGTVIKKLQPGKPGTKRYADRFGDALVCVRYRDEPERKRRLTTVELIVAERSFAPPPALVRIGFEETELRNRVKAEGGKWDPKRKLWLLDRTAVQRLRLSARVVADAGGKNA